MKEAKDKTDFEKIDPLIEVDVVGTNLDSGTINVMVYGYADNLIVYVGSKDVQLGGKFATTWAQIKADYGHQ